MSNQIEKCSIMFVMWHHTTNRFLSTNSVEQWLMVYVMWKLHAIFIKWYMVISEHKLIGFMSTELQNDDNDASLPFRLIWCVFICVINESNRSCSMNPLQIRRIDDLSVRAQSPFAESLVVFAQKTGLSAFWIAGCLHSKLWSCFPDAYKMSIMHQCKKLMPCNSVAVLCVSLGWMGSYCS